MIGVGVFVSGMTFTRGCSGRCAPARWRVAAQRRTEQLIGTTADSRSDHAVNY